MRLLIICLFITSICNGQAESEEIQQINQQIQALDENKAVLLSQLEVLKLDWIQSQIQSIGIPSNGTTEEVLTHSAFQFSYNEQHEQANWVMHIILPDILNGTASRTNDFRIDSLVSSGSAVEEDYFIKTLKSDSSYSYDGFGYDRGHLAPSADFKWSKRALSESYFYSNMSPQLADFNRFKWAELENWMRAYVAQNMVDLIIVTAPVLTDNLTKVDRSVNGLSVPELYVKVALDTKNNRAIGFVLPNEKINLPLEAFAVSVDSVENLIGYDLFSGLDDELEAKIEASEEYQPWLPVAQNGDVKAIHNKRLPKKSLSTYGVKVLVDDGKKHTVCGKVVSATKHEKGHVFINLDKKFPNQIFSVSIFSSNVMNFPYEPELYLIDKEVCFTGQVGDYQGTPNMVLDNSKQVKLLNEYK